MPEAEKLESYRGRAMSYIQDLCYPGDEPCSRIARRKDPGLGKAGLGPPVDRPMEPLHLGATRPSALRNFETLPPGQLGRFCGGRASCRELGQEARGYTKEARPR